MKKFCVLLISIMMIAGCTFNSPETFEDSTQSAIKWNELSYDWITEKNYHCALGAEPNAISGYFPLTFFHQDDFFSFAFENEYYTETYVISGRWLNDTIYYEFSPISITYQISGKEKTSFLNLKGSITLGEIQSECTLETEDGIIYPIALDSQTGDLIDNELGSSTYQKPMEFTDQLWVMCYSYMKHFYERMLRDEVLIQMMQQDMEKLLAEEMIDYQDMRDFDDPKVSFPNSEEFWKHLEFAHFNQAAFEWNGIEYDPWAALEQENPRILEISSSIHFVPVQDEIELTEENSCMTIFYMSAPVTLDALPMMHVYKEDQGYLIDGAFGQARFQSGLFTETLDDYFDDEKATKEFLSQIAKEDVVKAYLSVGMDIEKILETNDIDWIFQQIQSLANSVELEHISSEGMSEVNACFIFKKNGQLSSFCLHSLSEDYAWIRYEGKFTEFKCGLVLDEIVSKVKKAIN